jgi:uncharacterized protein YjbI with pentapeptide repeats
MPARPSAPKGPELRRPPRVADEELPDQWELADEDDLLGVALTCDFAGGEYSDIVLRECRVATARFTGSRFVRAGLFDCVVGDSDFSGATWEHCHFERVEFRHCRLSGLQAQSSQFKDVGFIDCKIDGGNFRMTTWERGELLDSHLVESDFYGARLPASRIRGCDLTNTELSKCDLTGSYLHGSRLDGIRGGDSLRGVTIGHDQIIPAALALFGAIGVSVDDDQVHG